MDSILPFRKLFAQLRKLFWVWLALAILAGIVTLLVVHMADQTRGHATTVISYSYNGIESGNDPSGNRFDPNEIKADAVIRAAVKEAGLEEEGLETEAIQDAVAITSRMPDGVLSKITKPESVFKGDQISSTETVKTQSYFPTQYNVSLDYGALGLNARQGAALLDQLAECYRQYFYDTYSFSYIGKSVQALDYRNYDYEDAVEVLDTKLTILQDFVAQLAALDTSRFTSKETGSSFSDLSTAMDPIRSADIMRVTSYISSSNLTRSKGDRINYFTYKIDNERRIQAQMQEMLNVVEPLISGYKKTTAVVAGYVGASTDENGETVLNYEVTQPSQTYDDLIDRRIEYRTSLSESVERIAKFQTRLEQLNGEENKASVPVVEEILESADQKIENLLTATTQTASEFYESVYLDRAVQILPQTTSVSSSFKALVSSAFSDGLAVEALLFGLFVLCAVILALLADRGTFTARVDRALEKTSPFRWGKQTDGKKRSARGRR
jgi:hypothetical protein